uniref:Uncharacterized protein n=1 Tax=Periophthalmus magnuspinnatus TaxID=409849 RepID=A0A3B4A5T5_9GOBI
MAASYDQLAHQVEALRQENSHLRRELKDNCQHLSKLETETFSMKEVLKQLQYKLEQEAVTLASSGRSDVLHQLKGKSLCPTVLLSLPPPLCPPVSPSSSVLLSSCLSLLLSFSHTVLCGAFRDLLLGQMDQEERERCWFFSQLEALTQRLAQLPRIDTLPLQMDQIRQQLEFEVQQVRSVMEERFGTQDQMVQRTQTESEQTELQTLNGFVVPQMEMVFWLLSMLANRDKEEMSRTLLALSSSQDSCVAMRKSGCVPLLVQILHESQTEAKTADKASCSREARSRAGAALHNIIFSQSDEGQGRREMRVLQVLEQVRTYCETGWDWIESHAHTPSPGATLYVPEPVDPQICQAVCAIMKLSFEEEYRRAMNELGGLQVVADLIHLENEMYGTQNDPINMALRRYAGMTLTNLTFGDVVNKATLCSRRSCLQALVAQLGSDSEELHQVVSSVLRNLSWRADISSKRVLRDIRCVSALMTCALQATKESTLKSLLSALWNLSAHSIDNKAAICSVEGALGFLVSTLTYRCQTNSLAIIESGGGILRNVSSLIATREDYRQVLRDHSCLQTLLQHLRSHSLTIVGNACGTLWNLSARSPKDQELLWDMGAVSMLRNLIHSKHKMIAMGSAAALRNLLTNRPLKYKDTAVVSPGSCMPSLYMRKQKALEAELDAKHLAETFDTIEKQSPKHLTLNKPLRHIESLAKDYASDSGCFDDDEGPNMSSSLETGSFSMLSMFLSNSNLIQNQAQKQNNKKERDMEPPQKIRQIAPAEDDVSAAAEKLAKKITNTVAKIDRLVDDITMHTSSEDSLSLSSEDHLADWPYSMDELNEGRAMSCSPCRFSDTSSLVQRDRLSRAHALLRLKAAHSSVSTDSLNSGSSDGYCGNTMGNEEIKTQDFNLTEAEKNQEQPVQTPVTAQAMRRQAWVPTAMTGGSMTKFSPMTSTRSPTIGPMETVQKYSVENTPICFSRCSSLSSLSSGEGDGVGALDVQSENELDSDSSLEIIEVEDGEVVKREDEDATLEDLSDSQLLVTDSKTFPSKETVPIAIPCPAKREKVFLRSAQNTILEDRSPSSSSENYIHETPLVMSRCSSVSSLGSFESPSIASSIQSDPCSEMIDGTISPSDLPDSPGQTMPPSRSKTPCYGEQNVPEMQPMGQWETSIRKFMEITDSKERFNPSDLDAMIYFTVEKPTENFSCASSLSALPLHEHYIQKDVELKLTPLLQQNDKNVCYEDDDPGQNERYSEGNSDDDIEILKECINSAMPSRFRKLRPSLMTVPPRIVMPQKDKFEDSDSAENTAVNFSSTTSLSDETLQYSVKERGAKECTAKGLKQEPMDDDAKRIEDLRIFSHFHKPNRPTYQPDIQLTRMSKHVVPTQRVLMQSKEVADRVASQRNLSPIQQRKMQVRKMELPVIKHNSESNLNLHCQSERTYHHKRNSSEDSNSFYDDKELAKRPTRKQLREASRNTLSKSMTNIGRIENSQKARGFHRIKQNLIKDESVGCYSLSSSLSSLSDAEFDDHKAKAQQVWFKNRHNKSMSQHNKSMLIHSPYEEQSSPSSVSLDSEDDLLQRCITSAMPKQRRKMSARKKKAEKQKQRSVDVWSIDEELDSDDMAWDKESDLNSVEWRAIQEGANSVVTGLQASKSQEPSSEETESVLSFMSTSSFTPKERKFAKEKKPNKPLDFAQRKPVANLPVVFRGRTVIYTPKKEDPPSQIPPPRKNESDAPKNPELAQHRSKSLHRLGRPQDTEWSLPKRSSTPPPRIPKSSSSGSSSSSTPSKTPQKKITSPIQTNKPIQKKNSSPSISPPATSPPERRGRSPVMNQNEKSPPPKTQKSPVRIPFMTAGRQPRPLSPLVTNQTIRQNNNNNNQMSTRRPPNRFDLMRMTSGHSSSGESDRNGFMRQLTFIKDSKTGIRRDGSGRNTPGSQNGSPRRAVPATAVFLCSSRCQELKVAVQPPKRVQTKTNQAPPKERPARRTSSESPGRAVRVTSRSSLRSSSSDSSGRAKSERDDTKKKGSKSRKNDGRVTWRRIRDEDVPQILKSTLPENALPLVPSPIEEKLPTILLESRKMSDATVQTEDDGHNGHKTNSCTSPMVDKTPKNSEDKFNKNDGDFEGPQTQGVVHFRQGSPSKSARVTPFNYVPSPIAVHETISEKTEEKTES